MMSLEMSLLRSHSWLLGEVFKTAAEAGYDVAEFADAFMQGEIAASMDDVMSSYHGMSPRYLVAATADELSLVKKPMNLQDPEQKWLVDCATGVGRMYRHWQVTRKTTSAEINKIAPYKFIQEFVPLFSCEEDHAIDAVIGNSKDWIYDSKIGNWRPPLPGEQTT